MMYGSGREAEEVVEEEGLGQLADQNQLQEIVTRVLTEHKDAVTRFRDGNKGSLGFLMGQVMQLTRGRANPKLANALLRKGLAGD